MSSTEHYFPLELLAESHSLFGLYTQITLFYPSKSINPSQISTTLSNGLSRLSSSFPWTAGRVIRLPEPDAQGREYRIRYRTDDQIALTVTEDREHTLDALREEGWPASLVDEEWLASCGTMSHSRSEKPVLLVKAVVMRDGLALTVNGEHQVLDMVGQGVLMDMLDRACKGHEFSEAEVRLGNADRTHIIPLLEDGVEIGRRLEYQIAPESKAGEPETAATNAADEKTDHQTVYFNVSGKALTDLKNEAMGSVEKGYVSTDDCLTALVWQSVLRARKPRLSAGTRSTLGRAVDARRYLGLEKSHSGYVQNMAYANMSVEELIEAPLGRVAELLRSKVDPSTCDLGMAMRELVTASHRAGPEERHKYGVTAGLALDVDLMVSSWAVVDCYAFDFGLELGKPEMVRRPRIDDVESLVYFMPRNSAGDGAVFVCLRTEDMVRLKKDQNWCKYTTYAS